MTTGQIHLLRHHAKTAAEWADEIRVEATSPYPDLAEIRSCLRQLEARIALLQSLLPSDQETRRGPRADALEEFAHEC